MAARVEDLVPEFRATYVRLLADCADNGTPMLPFYTLRPPHDQARLWRQSRTHLEIETGLQWLRSAGAHWIAEVIVSVGPQHGRWATNAVPGNSWHQWAEAGDAAAVIDGKLSWDTIPGERGGPGDASYRFYALRATELGLTPLGPRIGDWVHVQLRRESAPAHVFPWPEIDAEMRRRFAA